MSGNKKVLVVGGGISGMTVAIEASEAGCEVVLVERNPYLGGRVAQMNQYFPKLCPPTCGLEINLRRIRTSDRITCLTLAEVEKITGEPGNYQATIKQHPRRVNVNCTACNACVDVCPVDRSDDFNWGLGKTKAIFHAFDAAYPAQYVIDGGVCEGTSCGKCVEACKYEAIELEQKASTSEIEIGAVVFATGWEPYDATKMENLGFGQYKNVITNVMMERLAAKNGPTDGQIQRPSDDKPPKSIAFVQCAGSRDENHMAQCSGVCCMGSLKQATYIREQDPEAEVTIFYIDLRTPGRLEDFLAAREEDEKVSLIKGKVGKVEEDPKTGNLTVEAEDTIGGERIRKEVDMVVLATGMVPMEANVEAPKELLRDEFGFLVAEQAQSGLLAAGCAKRPVDVAACVRDATGMALKALQNCQ